MTLSFLIYCTSNMVFFFSILNVYIWFHNLGIGICDYQTYPFNSNPATELDGFAEAGPLSALNLLRFRILSAKVGRSKRPYDRRPWSIFILYFLLLVALAHATSFLYGRTVAISAVNQPQVGVKSSAMHNRSI